MRNVGVIKIIKSYKILYQVSSHERFIAWLRLTVGSSCAQLNLNFKKGVCELHEREKKHLLLKNIPDWRVLLCSIENFQPSLDPTGLTKSYLIGQCGSPNLGIVFTGLDFQKMAERDGEGGGDQVGFFYYDWAQSQYKWTDANHLKNFRVRKVVRSSSEVKVSGLNSSHSF